MRPSARPILLLLLTLPGCGPHARPHEVERRDGPAQIAQQAIGAPQGGLDAVATAPNAAPASSTAPETGGFELAGVDPTLESAMIIRTGQASLQVDSLEPALVMVRQLAGGAGGYIADSRMEAGERQLRSATVEIRVPAGRFDELGDGLSRIGRVEYLNVSSQDVGEEYTDVGARVANAHRLESRLVELIATRTGKLTDVLEIERELARVREEIERMEGRLRYLRAHAAMSTLSITVHERVPIVGQPDNGGVIAQAFRQAWTNFLGLLSGFIASLGVLLPLLSVIGAGLALVRRLWRRRAAATA